MTIALPSYTFLTKLSISCILVFICALSAQAEDNGPYTQAHDPDCHNQDNDSGGGGETGKPKKKPKCPYPPPDDGPDEEDDYTEDCQACETDGEDGTKGDGINEVTCTLSAFGLFSKEHRHDASDFEIEYTPVTLSGCSPCGSDSIDAGVSPKQGRLNTLSLKRYRRSLKYYGVGSFGRSHFSEYEDKIEIFYEDSWQGTGVGMCNVYLVNDLGDSHQMLEENNAFFGDTSVDGVYRDRWGFFRSLTLYDAADQVTADQTLAVKAILILPNGASKTFEIFVGYQDRRMGRVTHRTDRNGNNTIISYQNAIGSLTGNDRIAYWKINTVTDPYGNQATFNYQANPQGVNYLVESIDFPGGTTVSYSYDSNKCLTGISYPDGTSSSFSYAYDATLQLDTVTYDDAGAESTHRRKTGYYQALTYTLPDTTVINQTPGLMRKVMNPMGQTIAAHYPSTDSDYFFLYEGGNQFARIKTNNGRTMEKLEYATNYVHDENAEVPDVSGLNWEKRIEHGSVWYQELYTSATNETGVTMNHTVDKSKRALTKRTYGDGSEVNYDYNANRQVTDYTDRIGRVSKVIYDANGNMLSSTRGVGSPEEATQSMTYNSKGQPTSFTDANGNITNYEYDSTGYLTKIIEPADNPGDPRAEHVYTYNTFGRVATYTDPMGRVTSYGFDSRNRVTSITHQDGSIQQFVYGVGNQANLLVQEVDRTGSITAYDYDDYGRKILTTWGTGTPEQIQETCAYLLSTDLKTTCNRVGELTTYIHDYMNRVIAVSRQANTTTSLTSHVEYDIFGKRVSTTDAYGRSNYVVYDVNDNVVRRIQETVPGGVGTLQSPNTPPTGGFAGTGLPGDPYVRSLRDEDLTALPRVLTPNAPYLITDYDYDSEGQLISVTDPRGIVSSYTYDQLGRLIQRVEAVGTAVAATTESVYDQQGNVIEVRSPRYFDSADTNGYQKARTTRAYTGRNLLKTETVADGSSVAATRSTTYFLDGRKQADTDFRGNVIDYAWGFCCARFQALIEPLVTLPDGVTPERPARISRHNDAGDRTHEAVVRNYDGSVFPTFSDPTNVTDIPDAATINETTTAYDALHRPIAQTVWLNPLGPVDANNPPIAGENGIPATDGLTTRWTYDDNLTDGIGLDATYAAHIVGLNLGSGSDGKAVATTNPENETSVTIYDGLGRVVKSIDGNGNADSVTYDAIVTITGFGDVHEVTAADALSHLNKVRSDGMGRRIQSIDAENQVTNYGYDANGNLISYRDPNNVGEDCVFDERNRDVNCTDTQGDTTTRAYDANSNTVVMTDALGNDTTCAFDARDRKIKCTDRINATTTYAYDANNNLTSITDAEGSITTYAYDVRNLTETETYPLGNAGTTQKAYAYDAARRITSRLVNTVESPLSSETTNYVYDMANRMTTRMYPDETNADDTFTYDAASRLLTASSNRYSNTVTRAYDDDSKLISETLNIDGTNYPISYVYDVADRQTGIIYPNGKIVARSYTDRNQLQDVSYDSSVLSTSVYDDGMRETNRNYSNGVNTTWSYRAGDNAISRVFAPGVIDLSYTFDANKNKLTEDNAQNNGLSDVYGYDNQERLISWSTDGGVSQQTWIYSLVNDWNSTVRTGVDPISEARSHSDVHEISSINGQNFGYDFKGNMTNNPLKNYFYTWDAENRLKSVSGGATASYRYDAMNRRVQKSVTENAVTTVTTFVNNSDWQVLTEYVGTFESQSYVYATYIDDSIAVIKSDGSKQFYHRNTQYSIHAVTNSFGEIVEAYQYDAYGRQIVYTGAGVDNVWFTNDDIYGISVASAVGNPFGYTGRRYDHESDTWYFRNRNFDSNMGRFLNRDFLNYIDGNNLYSGYMYMSKMDPMGLYSCSDCMREKQNECRNFGGRPGPEWCRGYAADQCKKYCSTSSSSAPTAPAAPGTGGSGGGSGGGDSRCSYVIDKKTQNILDTLKKKGNPLGAALEGACLAAQKSCEEYCYRCCDMKYNDCIGFCRASYFHCRQGEPANWSNAKSVCDGTLPDFKCETPLKKEEENLPVGEERKRRWRPTPQGPGSLD